MKIALDHILEQAAAQGASNVLLMVGHPPIVRVGRVLQPPGDTLPLDFYDTQEIATMFLSDQASSALEENGSVELPFHIGTVTGQVSIFYGMGAHQLVFYLERV